MSIVLGVLTYYPVVVVFFVAFIIIIVLILLFCDDDSEMADGLRGILLIALILVAIYWILSMDHLPRSFYDPLDIYSY